MASISEDLVDAARAQAAGGASIRELAMKFGVSESGLRYRLNGNRKASGAGALEHDLLPDDDPDPTRNAPDGHRGLEVFTRDYRALDVVRLYPIGDFHIGSPGHNAAALDEWLAYLLSASRAGRNISLMITGDVFNAALKTSKSESYDERYTVELALDIARDKLEPVKHLIDVMIPGNHDLRVYKAAGIDPVRVLSHDLDVNYARAGALVTYLVGTERYQVYLRHGTGMDGSSQPGSRANAMARQRNAVKADIYISGHTHSPMVFRDRQFEVDPETGEGRWRRKLYVSSGSFLNYEEYAAERAFVANDIGAPRIRLDGTHNDAHASI